MLQFHFFPVGQSHHRAVAPFAAFQSFDLGLAMDTDQIVVLDLGYRGFEEGLRIGFRIEEIVDVTQLPAQFAFPLHQVHSDALPGQIQSGRHASQPSANDQNPLLNRLRRFGTQGLQASHLGQFGHGHCHQALGLGRGRIGFVVDVGALLAQVGPLHEARVESSPGHQSLELGGVKA